METELNFTAQEIKPTGQYSSSGLDYTNEGAVLKTSLDIHNFSNSIFKAGILPERYDSVAKIASAVKLAIELGLKPICALRQIAFIKGTITIFGDLPMTIVERSGLLEWKSEFLIDTKGEKICYANKNLSAPYWAAVCMTKRKGQPEVCENIFSIDDQKNAGLSSDVWKKYPKIMLKYRARSANLKDNFPDCLNGISIAEYDFDNPDDKNGFRILDKEKMNFEANWGKE